MRYDITLKELLQSEPLRLVEQLAGAAVSEWINVEVPRQMARMDLNARLTDGTLFHLELQGDNDGDIGMRMLGYYAAHWKWSGVPPRQVVLYVGQKRLKMEDRVEHVNLQFRYKLIDIRNVDGEALLDSRQLGDNLLAILCRMNDQTAGIRRILQRIASLSPAERADAFTRLMVLSGLRKLDGAIREEVRKMPITIDLMENEFFRERFLAARAEGREQGEREGELQGRREGEQQGRREGELALLRRMLEHRLGALPAWAIAKLDEADLPDLETWSTKLLDAMTLEDALATLR
ncbi:MAG TPA: DUF4351 domain-containing protein [Bryobacteraceae bacterium]|nr:DUF4351 domain-containing protein [Bryobacteraceae bacterium]